MTYDAAQFRAKTATLLEEIAQAEVRNKGYILPQIFVATQEVSDLITYINANPADPQTFGYNRVNEDLYIKPRLPLAIKITRI